MDSQLPLFILVFLFFGIYIYLKTVVFPKVKGGMGELEVSLRLRRLNKKKYIVLSNILLKVGDSTTQIDHLVISKSGIFVIETKNYKGWIHGHENSEYWKQTLYRKQYPFKNPINQNKVHVYFLKKSLQEYPHLNFYPLVVFTGRAVLKNVKNWTPVIYAHQLIKTIRQQDEEPILTYEQMKSISSRLDKIKLLGGKERRGHVRRIRKRSKENNKNSVSGACPVCGGSLVKRQGRYGGFYGCSNFPRCTYTINLGENS
ncbi:NERD domain-containing protein [Algoriphagus marincola]|uniref:NERD domain-containing protein n=1 Tax=Algoriphagus marincola TaxID=264027 RepID=UPI000410A09B|nr:NERD domain-containing protein [Algoriphagus marincola]